MKPDKHIKKLYDRLHKMTMEGLIDAPDKYMAVKDIEIAIHELQKTFEREITDKRER